MPCCRLDQLDGLTGRTLQALSKCQTRQLSQCDRKGTEALQGLSESEISLTQEQQVLLQELEVKVEQTLLTAMAHGRVVIVTNAADGWIETSCAAFMPGLRPLLDEIDLLSARASYAAQRKHTWHDIGE
eukprot:Skav217159  [mRNA]  locus=scaffold566:85766:87088:+ [translate_table: standard]